jgi:hypothetical protein
MCGMTFILFYFILFYHDLDGWINSKVFYILFRGTFEKI